MLTEKDYCDYDTCVALKELGYKVPTSAYYMPHHKDLIWVSNPFRGGYVIDCFYSHNSLPKDVMTANFIDAPTLWEAQKWLREEKGIFVYIDVPWKTDDGLGWSYFCCNKPMTEEEKEVYFASGRFYDSYEKALLENIKASVKILTIKNE